MKTFKQLFLILAVFTLVLGACKKSDPPPQKNSSGGSGSTCSMNSSECALHANWLLKEVATRDSFNHNYSNLQMYNNPATYYLNLMNTPDTNSSGSYVVTGYKADPSNVPISCIHTWRAEQDTLIFLYPVNPPNDKQKYIVQMCTTDSLILRQYGSANQYTQRWYFHK